MTYRITYTARFKKNYGKLTEKEKALIREKVKLLAEDPRHPSLRTKRIKGTKDLFECSINMDIRIIWCYEEQRLLMLLDVGHHSVLDRVHIV